MYLLLYIKSCKNSSNANTVVVKINLLVHNFQWFNIVMEEYIDANRSMCFSIFHMLALKLRDS